MEHYDKVLNKLKGLLKHKKSKKYYAEKLNITEEEVNNLLEEIKNPTEVGSYEVEANKEKGEIKSKVVLDFEPKTTEELYRLHKVDRTKYFISNYFSKLQPSGKFTSTIFAKRKTPNYYTPEDFSNFLKNYVSDYTPITFVRDNDKELIDIELSISDFHLAKKYVEGNNNPKERAVKFFNIAFDLIKKVSAAYQIDRFVLPISNDFFHTDNYQNSTTNGTPQDVILDYASEYELGFDVLVNTIKLAKANSQQVDVVLVQGNHDRTKSYYVAHALEVYFSKDKNIRFKRNADKIKGIVLGNTFIGYHHGNCKIDELPLLFATHPDYSTSFGMCTYREIHTGDKHHYMAKEVKGVRIQQMPSLSGTDRWHRDNNYVNQIRAALLLGYDKVNGKVVEFEARI